MLARSLEYSQKLEVFLEQDPEPATDALGVSQTEFRDWIDFLRSKEWRDEMINSAYADNQAKWVKTRSLNDKP
jgi:hypothetical protein